MFSPSLSLSTPFRSSASTHSLPAQPYSLSCSSTIFGGYSVRSERLVQTSWCQSRRTSRRPSKCNSQKTSRSAKACRCLAWAILFYPGTLRQVVEPDQNATVSVTDLLPQHSIFVALALRYDYHRAIKHNPPPKPSQPFARPYFHTVFVAYIAGLVTTVYVMHTFRAAQPALLYLSPACIGSVIACAVVRGEVKELWNFDDGSDDDKPKAKDGDKKEADQASPSEEKKADGALESGPEKKQDDKEDLSVAQNAEREVPGQRVLRSRINAIPSKS